MAKRPANLEDRPLKTEEEVRRKDQYRPPPAAQANAAPDDSSDDGAGSMLLELPARGYPPYEQPLTDWFRQKYRRDPTERELGALMAAMNERDAPPPREGPKPDLEGWSTDVSTPPAPRR